MKTLKLLSALIDYPQDALWAQRDAVAEAARDPAVPPRRQAEIATFASALLALDPMTAQERWLGLFDRGRSMSLLLFEHVHGESRDRGQAMVDLIDTYRRNGFELSARELPDYLPLVLEYLSQRPEAEWRDWLSNLAHILKLLAARCAERDSPYGVLFEILVELGEGRVDLDIARRCAQAEARDDTPEAMDRVWEEEAVRFSAASQPAEACSRSSRTPNPGTSSDRVRSS